MKSENLFAYTFSIKKKIIHDVNAYIPDMQTG